MASTPKVVPVSGGYYHGTPRTPAIQVATLFPVTGSFGIVFLSSSLICYSFLSVDFAGLTCSEVLGLSVVVVCGVLWWGGGYFLPSCVLKGGTFLFSLCDDLSFFR